MGRARLLASLALLGCGPLVPDARPPILLFTGTGTSDGDAVAVATILKANHLQYATATSRQLNALTASQLLGYRLIIVPGGNFIDMSNSLTPVATANVHEAVQDGLNYLGICAGAFLAGHGHGHYNSFDLAMGTQFGFYAAENRGIRKAAVAIDGVTGPPTEQYWEDGPELTGWGAVVGRYPDGTPAITEGPSGKGWVVLSGVHPEAPDGWRRGLGFTTASSIANAYAGTLIQAALSRTPLPHF